MPPSTANVRNGWPTTASIPASQSQIVVATTRPSRVPSQSELCFMVIWEALAELGLSPSGLDLLTELAQARAGLPLAEPGGDDRRDLVVMLERDGLVQSRTDGAAGGRVTIALTSLGAAQQQAGAERLAGA